MFNKLRYRIAYHLAKKAAKLVETRDFRKMMKGLSYVQYSLMIHPDGDIKNQVTEQLRGIVDKHTTKSQDEGLV